MLLKAGFHVAYLVPKDPDMTTHEKLWYVEAIKGLRFRFSYGPQANKQLPKLRIPRAPFFGHQSTLPDLVSLVA